LISREFTCAFKTVFNDRICFQMVCLNTNFNGTCGSQ
jgi:hypothetical protein